MKLLSVDTNAKTKKGQVAGYLTGILYLAPADMAMAGKNLCPHASEGCKAACLFSAGRGAFSNVQQSRIRKTLAFFQDRQAFIDQLKKDIQALAKKAKKTGMLPCVRLNGTSDVPWHKMGIMEDFKEIPFYDYTPNKERMLEYLDGKLPKNYNLTFSRKENNQDACQEIIAKGGNVAAVFRDVPEKWNGKTCFDGDQNDLRFLDPKGVVVALKAKGKAKQDTSGFVVLN